MMTDLNLSDKSLKDLGDQDKSTYQLGPIGTGFDDILDSSGDFFDSSRLWNHNRKITIDGVDEKNTENYLKLINLRKILFKDLNKDFTTMTSYNIINEKIDTLIVKMIRDISS